jgi:hypothetical protein
VLITQSCVKGYSENFIHHNPSSSVRILGLITFITGTLEILTQTQKFIVNARHKNDVHRQAEILVYQKEGYSAGIN